MPHTIKAGSLIFQEKIISYVIKKSRRRKRTISWFIDSPQKLVIYAPYHLSQKAIEQLTLERASWILKKFDNHYDQNEITLSPQFCEGEKFLFLGVSCVLSIKHLEIKKPQCELCDQQLIMTFPLGASVQSELISKILVEWYYQQAEIIFKERLEFWKSRLNVDYKKLIVTHTCRRWGSCDVKNIIRLNWPLIMAPLELIDYVVAHELCHVVHKNHSADFWDLLLSVMPDCKKRRKVLRASGMRFYFDKNHIAKE